MPTIEEQNAAVTALTKGLDAEDDSSQWSPQAIESLAIQVLNAAEAVRAKSDPIGTIFKIITQNTAQMEDLFTKLGGITGIADLAPDILAIWQKTLSVASEPNAKMNLRRLTLAKKLPPEET